MSDKYSLIDLMKNDFCFESLKGAKKDTKKSKESLDKMANEYSQKYQNEIQEGTRKRQLMLEQAGIQDGTPEAEQYFKNNDVFMPTVHTPILNMIYFLTEEYGEQITDVSELKKIYEERYGVLTENYESDIDISGLDGLYEEEGDQIDDFETEETVPHMEKYIYQNMDAGTFGKLKKLKALSMSDNEEEAKAAWLKCMEICEKYGLEFKDIPTKYD